MEAFQPHRRKGSTLAALLLAALALPASRAFADELERRVDVGLGLRFMPTGSFEWSGRPGHPSTLKAIPALGGAPFVDYRLNQFFSVGFMPELTLNVLPDAHDYTGAIMMAGSFRVKAQYPEWRFVVPYVLFSPGYAWLFDFENSSVGDVRSHGFVLGAYGGARVPVSPRHAVFAEAGYLRGFQKNGDQSYAPSYLVLALGWQAAL
jgi:hypothetical protein